MLFRSEEADSSSANMDFNTYLIYDYKNTNNKTFIDEFYHNRKLELSDQDQAILNQVIGTYPSIYEFKEQRNECGLFKDIFQNIEYLVKDNDLQQFNFSDLVFARTIKIDEGYVFWGTKVHIPGLLKTSIERNILSYYERYKAQNQYGSWGDFLEKDRLMLYKHVGIATEVINQEYQDEEKFMVWQSVYLIKDTRKIKEKLLKFNFIHLDDEDNGSLYFKILDGSKVLAEFVLTGNKGELECNSERDWEKAKRIIESNIGNSLTHYKDEVISINDIL